MEYNQFTREQVLFITYLSGCSSMVFTFTRAYYTSGRSGWIVSSIGILLLIPFALAILYICNECPGCTIFDIIEKGLGKIIFYVVFFIYCIITLIGATSMLNLTTQTIKIYFLSLTPIWVIMAVCIFICILFVNNKILLFGRTVEFMTIWYTINYFAGFSISFTKEFKLENIIPIFDTSLSGFAEGIFFSLGAACDILLLVMVMAGNIPKPYKHKMWVINGIFLWAVILPLAILVMQGISGVEIVQGVTSAGVGISRSIYVGNFLKGLELFIFSSYYLMTLLKISVYMYSIWIPLRKRINQKYWSIILICIGTLMLVSSIWLNSYNNAFSISIYMSYYVLVPFVVAVLLISFLSLFLTRRKTGSDAK